MFGSVTAENGMLPTTTTTTVPPTTSSRVPKIWGEDHLLGRMPDARGHNANRLAPGGFVASMNPDGTDFEHSLTIGYRF